MGGVARVNGELALSRGFGDASHKQTGGPAQEDRPVTADPEMGHFQCDQSDFVLLVCDGVSEGNFPNPEVVEFVARRSAGGAVRAGVRVRACGRAACVRVLCVQCAQ